VSCPLGRHRKHHFATTRYAYTAYTASVATTHGIASSPGRIGNACRTSYATFAHAASPASDPNTCRADAFTIAAIPITTIATAAEKTIPRRLGTMFGQKQYHHKMYFYWWFWNFK
jgi:hypothetical protein